MNISRNDLLHYCVIAHTFIVTFFMLALIEGFWPSSGMMIDGAINWRNVYKFLDAAFVVLTAVGHSIFALCILHIFSSYSTVLSIARNVVFVYSVVTIYGFSGFIFATAYW